MRRRTPRKGWDSFATPVPGNVMGALQELGVEVIRETAGEILGKCPAHFERTGKEDRHPSWSVNAETGIMNCFSCGFRGPFVVLVEYVLKVDRSDAVSWVRQRGGIERVKKALSYIENLPTKNNDTTLNINEASLSLYTLPPEEALDSRGIDAGSAEHYGVLWDPAREMWILPIRDPYTGKLWGWQEKNARHFRNIPYGVEKSKTLFGIEQFEGRVAILVESPLDAPYFHTMGFDGALGTYGSEVSDEQMDIVLDLADEVICALDPDAAGDKGHKRLLRDYAKRTHLRFFDYAGLDRDPGGLVADEIAYGIANAYGSVRARF